MCVCVCVRKELGGMRYIFCACTGQRVEEDYTSVRYNILLYILSIHYHIIVIS